MSSSLENCTDCGTNPEVFHSTNVLYVKEKHTQQNGTKSSSSWWCFGTKRKSTPKECPDYDSIIVGKYEKRRSTVAYTHRISNFTGVKKKIQETKFGLAPPVKTNLKFLLVFDLVDLTCEALRKAAGKMSFEVTHCSTKESAFDEFQSKHHDLIVIDTRSKNLDFYVLCRALRATKGCQHAPIVALVRRNIFEKDDRAVRNLLEAGFNKCLVESSSVTNYMNELMQLRLSDMKFMTLKSVSQTLYAALDKCNNLVFITDENYKCQYSNVIVEKVLNIRQEEIVGKNLSEDILCEPAQLNAITSFLLRHREWTGLLTLKRKNAELVALECKAIPIACYGRLATHYVLVMDATGSISDVRTYKEYQTIGGGGGGGSSIMEKRSSISRKISASKLRALPLEAPITKIVGLMDEVRQKVVSNTELVGLLDKAEDMLRHSDLYSSRLRQDNLLKPNEPVVSELITALLSNQPLKANVVHVASQRGSDDSSMFKVSKSLKINGQMDKVLEKALTWRFEIFQLEEMTKQRPLQFLGMYLCQHFNVGNVLSCDDKTLKNWFIIIESHYHPINFYHNSSHAADVMQATAGFLKTDPIRSMMEPLDVAICLLAAAAHDVDHPGKSSAFLANSDNTLAILYNDVSILENHHAATMFKLTLGDDRVNIFKNLDRDTYKIVRHNIIDMILATEMTKHFEHLTKFVNIFCTTDDDEDNNDLISLSLPENIALIKRMLIKCADVSNPTRPFRIYVEWARRIAEEYFQQTDEEKVSGLPVVMPMFDRSSCSVPKSQIGFIDYIVTDMFEAWNAFIDMPELVNYLRQNYIKWKEYDEKGHSTLADIQQLQSSEGLSPILPY